MLSKKLEGAVNEQIKNELYSAYLYLAMAAHCEHKNFKGFANWLKIQAKEEVAHAMRLYDFVNDRGGKVVLSAIDQPPAEYQSLTEIFEKVLNHEKGVTTKINHLYELAKEENDYPLQVHLQWFIDEQVEEEKNPAEILAMLQLIGESGSGIMMLDHELGERKD
ncbi:ferritin [Candidatus Sordicultor fermentans]|uniref:ferritin n=1 Tax=Candidatus Sordicultor fermentans TaxID=1953203 RepID=UPI0016A45DB5|nr:ferritin [Atribacterota bacterium]MDY0134783.1 ferritin [Atribacterota bacterium]NLY05377.1 ferritin [Candidatus Atribacteria bacterium]HPZ40659.1 ferritin [Candidatus Atribacteria bacterium]HQD33809.1 ferritin [Candidatus Atribacteria bacterium]